VQTDAGEGTSAPRLAPVVKKPQMAAKPRAVTGAEDNFLRKSIQFLREVKTELKKVTWPSRKQDHGFHPGCDYIGDDYLPFSGCGGFQPVQPCSNSASIGKRR
jgi:hypothetical protein